MAWEARLGLKLVPISTNIRRLKRLNGLGSPFGIETAVRHIIGEMLIGGAKWPGKPVRD